MTVTTPPAIDALPAAPDPNDRATFNTRAYPWAAAQNTFRTQVAAVAANVAANATDCAGNATAAAASQSAAAASAASAAATAGAAAWASGTYALNANAISQINFQTYRKITASSVTTIDPSLDKTNWTMLGAAPSAASVIYTLQNLGGF